MSVGTLRNKDGLIYCRWFINSAKAEADTHSVIGTCTNAYSSINTRDTQVSLSITTQSDIRSDAQSDIGLSIDKHQYSI